MHRAPGHAALLLRLIEAGEQEHQERHVVVQGHPAQKAMPLLERPAQSAVAAAIAAALFVVHSGPIGNDITEHQVVRSVTFPQDLQVTRIRPLPLGTRRTVPH